MSVFSILKGYPGSKPWQGPGEPEVALEVAVIQAQQVVEFPNGSLWISVLAFCSRYNAATLTMYSSSTQSFPSHKKLCLSSTCTREFMLKWSLVNTKHSSTQIHINDAGKLFYSRLAWTHSKIYSNDFGNPLFLYHHHEV